MTAVVGGGCPNGEPRCYWCISPDDLIGGEVDQLGPQQTATPT